MPETFDPDFGVPVDVLKDDQEILDLPEEVAIRRAERMLSGSGSEVAIRVVPESTGQAKAAMVAEVNDAPVRFTFDGEAYSIPLMGDWDIEIFEPRVITLSVKLLLGPDQYQRFVTQDDAENPGQRIKRKRTINEANALFSAALQAAGTQPGE